MSKNRVREIRKRRGMSADALAEKLGLSRVQVTRIEAGSRGLSIPHAEAIAMALDTTVTELLGLDSGKAVSPPSQGLAEEAEDYTSSAGDIVSQSVKGRENVSQMRVKKSMLDQLDILDRDILSVDFSAATVASIPSLARKSTDPIVVVAVAYSDQSAATGTTIIRQFVLPNLLITNSRTNNDVPRNLDTDDVHIRGLVIAKHREMGPRLS